MLTPAAQGGHRRATELLTTDWGSLEMRRGQGEVAEQAGAATVIRVWVAVQSRCQRTCAGGVRVTRERTPQGADAPGAGPLLTTPHNHQLAASHIITQDKLHPFPALRIFAAAFKQSRPPVTPHRSRRWHLMPCMTRVGFQLAHACWTGAQGSATGGWRLTDGVSES